MVHTAQWSFPCGSFNIYKHHRVAPVSSRSYYQCMVLVQRMVQLGRFSFTEAMVWMFIFVEGLVN